MMIGGSLFPHRPVHEVTWVSRDGVTENKIDHICINRKWRRSLLDVRNKRSADIASDHHLLIGEIRLRISRIHRQEEKIGRRFNTRRLEDAAVKRFFVEELENRAVNIPEGGCVEDQWSAIKNAFIATGENNLGELRTRTKQWITDTWRKIEERRTAKAAIERAKTRGAKAVARQRYSVLEKEVKRSCRRDKRAWADSLADEGEKAANTGDIRLLYDVSRRLSWTKMNATMPVKDTSGKLLPVPADQLKRWFEHLENLFQVSVTPSTPQHDPPRVRRITRVNTEASLMGDRNSHP